MDGQQRCVDEATICLHSLLTYSIISGVLGFLIRTRSMCGRRCRRFTYGQICLLLCSDIESTINPLSLSKADFKKTQVPIQVDMNYVKNVVAVASSNIALLTERIHFLGQKNFELKNNVLRDMSSLETPRK